MFVRKRFDMILLVAMFSCIAFSPALSRLWKPAPTAIANDYAFISHDRGNGEFVSLRWLAPPTFAPTSQGAALRATLEQYVVIMVVHGEFIPSSGEMSFINGDAPEAKDQSDNALKVVSLDTLSPIIVGALATQAAGLRQALGAMGKAMKTFVFDAGAVRSCESGRLSVQFAGETYTWDTPFPGCEGATPAAAPAARQAATAPVAPATAPEPKPVTTARIAPTAATSTAPNPIELRRTIAADHELRLDFFYSINPDCTSIGFATVRVIEPPKHGRIAIENGTGFTSFTVSNPRIECNKRRSEGVVVTYAPDPGFVGADSVDLESIFASGDLRKQHYAIDIK